MLLVKFFFNVRSDILLNIVFFQSLSGAVHGILLHVLRHVGILNNGLVVSHILKGGDRVECSTSLFLSQIVCLCGYLYLASISSLHTPAGHSNLASSSARVALVAERVWTASKWRN
ncbi:hypothetical protein AHF37_03643 [Paragonimus kellicotti]|nr:hypothetical protein AHF37_03643 [Paragonimus kellicotti]